MRDVAPPDTGYVLSATEFDVVWERLGLGPTPVVLSLPSPGRTHSERRVVEDAAWSSLEERDLAARGRPAVELVDLLQTLAAPAERLELRSWIGTTVRALAASRDGARVLALRRDGTVALRTCDSIPVALVGVLPAGPAGPGRAGSVPSATLAAAAGDAPRTGLRAALVTRGIAPAEAGLLAGMLRATGGQAQIAASVADRWGVLRRHPGVLTLVQGLRGRYLLTRSDADDGVEWTTVAPTDERRLRHRVSQLLAGADA